jgi:hypothetical protein
MFQLCHCGDFVAHRFDEIVVDVFAFGGSGGLRAAIVGVGDLDGEFHGSIIKPS